MQRVFSVAFSADSQYVLSGSDDTNLRIWKAEASKSIGTDNNRAERKKLYLDSLKKRFKHVSEIRRMNKDKKEPKAIKKAKSIAHTQKLSERRKMENVIAHSKPGSVSVKAAREKAVLVEQK
jgi:WD repeat and SOF domain-containing protein 1